MKAIVVVFFLVLDAFMISLLVMGDGDERGKNNEVGEVRKIKPMTRRAPAYHKSQAKVPDPRDKQAHVLALNIYHESRGLRGPRNVGWRSVAAVVFNRLDDERFPKTIEGVVFQKKNGTCAFSWYCDSAPDRPRNIALYKEVLREARKYISEYESGVWRDPTLGAHSYHALTIAPNEYFQRLEPIRVIYEGSQGHVFYR